MAKIPIKPIWKFAKANYKQIGPIVAVVGKVGMDFNKKVKERKKEKEEVPFQKERYQNLESKNRKELMKYKLEVEQVIEEIKAEKDQQGNVKKVLHSKRFQKWDAILKRIENWISMKDYQEFLLIFNDPNHESIYFEGFIGLIERFKELMEEDNDKLHQFIHDLTKKDIIKIQSDFSRL